ncbi:MAG: MopE-related protein [Pseudomonadota bacterium]
MIKRLLNCNVAVLAILFLFYFTLSSVQAAWVQQTNSDINQLRTIWGVSSNRVFAIGDYGTILHYDGSTWSKMPSGIDQNIFGVWGASGSNVFAVADSGKIIHFDGSAWSSMTSPVSTRLRDAWGTSATDVFAVGENGVIIHYNGSAWSTMTSPTTLTLQGVWGSSSINVFAVGGPSGSGSGNGIILKYDGVAWSISLNASSVIRLHDAWGSSDNNIFAVGESGSILHTTDGGGTWVPMVNPVKDDPTITLRDIWGSSATDMFAAGDNGTILHYDGSLWSKVYSNLNAVLHGIGGDISGRHIYAVGRSGILLVNERPDFNTPPVASYFVSPSSGDTATVFTFNASDSEDKQDAKEALQVRWDFENDGTWDTEYSTDKNATHTFVTAASHSVKLEVKDTDGLTASITHTLDVSPVLLTTITTTTIDNSTTTTSQNITSTTSISASSSSSSSGGSRTSTTTAAATSTSSMKTTSTTTAIAPPPVTTTTTAGAQKCTDNDNDGYFAEGGDCGEKDCNDNDIAVSPAAAEVCDDGKDNNCDGVFDESCGVTCQIKTFFPEKVRRSDGGSIYFIIYGGAGCTTGIGLGQMLSSTVEFQGPAGGSGLKSLASIAVGNIVIGLLQVDSNATAGVYYVYINSKKTDVTGASLTLLE